MKKIWKWVVGVAGTALLAVGAVLALMFYRNRNQKLGKRLKTFAREEAERAEKEAIQDVRDAEEKLVTEWQHYQAEMHKKVKNEAASISDDELFDRLRNPNE